MEKQSVIYQWFKFLFFATILALTYLYVLPALASTYPRPMLQKISDQDIDARALFYTESDDALRAYYFLRLEGQRTKKNLTPTR
ncbi:MAG: hypothetical protein HKN76_03640 [Saprospiraceae bacterium]|nr:hypothetical protein [Saprospiraceae bacterium]